MGTVRAFNDYAFCSIRGDQGDHQQAPMKNCEVYYFPTEF
jgi:hypothetical protein